MILVASWRWAGIAPMTEVLEWKNAESLGWAGRGDEEEAVMIWFKPRRPKKIRCLCIKQKEL